MSAARGPAPGRRRTGLAHGPAPAGFTVIEVLMAVMVLGVALLSIAGLAATAARMARGGSNQVVAAAVAQSRFDSLSSLPCRTLGVPSPTVGTASTRGVVESWAVTDGYNVKNFVDTLTVPGRTGRLVYRTVLPCRD